MRTAAAQAVVVALLLALAACSPAPQADVASQGPSASAARSSAPSASGRSTGSADNPSQQGVLPGPAQRKPGPATEEAPDPSPTPSAENGAHSDPAAIDVVVNKRRPLTPLDFAPTDLQLPAVATATDNGLLRPETATAVEAMFAAAADDGVGLVLVSGYRSYAVQESTYSYWVGRYGDVAGADTVSARPGYSEHQTGLAFDIAQADGVCTLVSCFAETAAAQWAAANAADFGIILRYPLGAHPVTGFSAEPWHFRYVGKEIALAMKADGTQTLEEHFGLPPAPSY